MRHKPGGALGSTSTPWWNLAGRAWEWLGHERFHLTNVAAIGSLLLLIASLYVGFIAAGLLPSPMAVTYAVGFDDYIIGQSCFSSETALLVVRRRSDSSDWYRFALPRVLGQSITDRSETWILVGPGEPSAHRDLELNAGSYDYQIESRATLTKDGRSVRGSSGGYSPNQTRFTVGNEQHLAFLLYSVCPATTDPSPYRISLCRGSECANPDTRKAVGDQVG